MTALLSAQLSSYHLTLLSRVLCPPGGRDSGRLRLKPPSDGHSLSLQVTASLSEVDGCRSVWPPDYLASESQGPCVTAPEAVQDLAFPASLSHSDAPAQTEAKANRNKILRGSSRGPAGMAVAMGHRLVQVDCGGRRDQFC